MSGKAEAVVIVTRLKEDRLEVLTSSDTLLKAALSHGEHPCEGALRALDQANVGSDAFQAFRKLTTQSQSHYFQASPESCDESRLPHGCAWMPLAAVRATASGGDAEALATLD